MRKLAPMFITTSILALAAGNVLANNTSTLNSTDKNGSPTVSDNTNKQPLSYSDKSNTAKGTNARMNDKAGMATGTAADATTDKVNPSWASDEDKNAKIDTDKAVKKAKKDKVAAHTTKHSKHVAKRTTTDTTASPGMDTTMSGTASSTTSAMPAPTANSSTMNPPLSGTKGEAANSMTGKSAGQ